jgi:hypothetical protein
MCRTDKIRHRISALLKLLDCGIAVLMLACWDMKCGGLCFGTGIKYWSSILPPSACLHSTCPITQPPGHTQACQTILIYCNYKAHQIDTAVPAIKSESSSGTPYFIIVQMIGYMLMNPTDCREYSTC